jgi:hypothetical protein
MRWNSSFLLPRLPLNPAADADGAAAFFAAAGCLWSLAAKPEKDRRRKSGANL